jgi:thioredoxin-like negative regulator of GroEL
MVVISVNSNYFQAPGGRVMKISIPGHVLVMFKQHNCVHCRNFQPLFEALAARESRVKFVCADVQDSNRKIVRMAQRTTTPIKTVPAFIFYFNGAPVAIYKGHHVPQKLQIFIEQMLKVTGSAGGSNFVNTHEIPGGYGIGISQHELDLQQRSDNHFLPANIIPYNAEYLKFIGPEERLQ